MIKPGSGSTEDCPFSIVDEKIQSNKTLSIANIESGNAVDIAPTGISYTRATPKWVRRYLAAKNMSTGWIAKDSSNIYYFYIPCVTSAPSNTSFFDRFSDDYIPNSQFKIYILWGSNDTVASGKTTTFTPVYGIHRIGSAPDSLIVGTEVPVSSPHTQNQLIETLLLTVTPTDTEKNDILMFLLKMAFSDSTWARFFYAIILEYQSAW